MECSIWLSSEYMIAGIFIQMSSNHSVFFSYIIINNNLVYIFQSECLLHWWFYMC